MSAIFAWPQRRAAACALVFLHKWLFATLPQALILCRVDIVSSHSNRCEVSTFLTGLLFHQAVFPCHPSRAAAGALVFLHNSCHRGRRRWRWSVCANIKILDAAASVFFAFQIAHGIFFELCLSRLRRLSVVVIEQMTTNLPKICVP